MQSVFFRVSFLVFFCLFIGVFVYAYYTEVALEQMGESAPFSTEVARVDDSIEEDPINQAHRTRKEMQVWLVETVSELLNIDSTNKSAVMRDARILFTDAAYAQYQTYLSQANVLADIEVNKMTLGAIVDETPLQLNGGVIGDRYRWLFDVPVIVTTTPVPSTAQNPPQNKKSLLRLQLGRTESPENQHKLVIESWQINPRR